MGKQNIVSTTNKESVYSTIKRCYVKEEALQKVIGGDLEEGVVSGLSLRLK